MFLLGIPGSNRIDRINAFGEIPRWRHGFACEELVFLSNINETNGFGATFLLGISMFLLCISGSNRIDRMKAFREIPRRRHGFACKELGFLSNSNETNSFGAKFLLDIPMFYWGFRVPIG